ncbi:MAG: hypothetical protein RL745_1036 [Actinomycetota bacterium]
MVGGHGLLARQWWWRYVVPGVLGASLITLASVSIGHLPLTTGWLQWDAVIRLRSTGIGSFTARTAIVAGIAILTQCWLALGVDIYDGVIKDRDARRLTAVMAAWCAPLLVCAPLFSRDTYSYYLQGRLMNAGYNPYTTGVDALPDWFRNGADPIWSQTPTPYGPLFLMIERAVAWVCGESALWAVFVFRASALVGLWLTAWALARVCRRTNKRADAGVWLAVMNPLVIIDIACAGHNDMLMVALMLWAWDFALQRRAFFAALLLAAAVGIKPIALLAVPFLALAHLDVQKAPWPRLWERLRSWIALGATSLGLLLLLSLINGTGLGWVQTIVAPTKLPSPLSITYSLGVTVGHLLDWLGAVRFDVAAAGFKIAGLAIALIIVLVMANHHRRGSILHRCAWAFAAVVLLSPTVHSWYLLWVLAIAAAAGVRRHLLPLAIIAVITLVGFEVAGSGATSDTFVDWFDQVTVAVAVAVTLAVALSWPRERALLLSRGDEPKTPASSPSSVSA